MSTSSEKANLARIRDNQRRSRARRKEYLLELETKLRNCEMQGVEASAEIQNAARRVADENRRLRNILREKGLMEDDDASAVIALETLLNSRRKCYLEGQTPDSSSSVDDDSRTMAGGQHGWDQSGGREAEAGIGRMVQQLHIISSPSSSSTINSRNNSRTDLPDLPAKGRPTQPQSQPSQPNLMMVYGTQSPNDNPIMAQSHPVQIDGLYDYDHRVELLPQDYEPAYQGYGIHGGNMQHHAQPYGGVPHASSYPPTCLPSTPSNSNLGSDIGTDCIDAADMLTAISGGTAHPMDVRVDLGCIPQNGMDCHVDNNVVYNLMDRYANQDMGYSPH